MQYNMYTTTYMDFSRPQRNPEKLFQVKVNKQCNCTKSNSIKPTFGKHNNYYPYVQKLKNIATSSYIKMTGILYYKNYFLLFHKLNTWNGSQKLEIHNNFKLKEYWHTKQYYYNENWFFVLAKNKLETWTGWRNWTFLSSQCTVTSSFSSSELNS